ncbi:MAG: response regulator [Thiohalomonas sp.]|nr:response regulator [Thiohalomonas sp.]
MWFSKPSVLVIDDDTSIGILAKARLSTHDKYKVVLASNAFDGLKLVNNNNPALIILDWVMPGMNDLDVLKQIKNDPNTAHIPILMLTGKNLVGEIEDAFACRCYRLYNQTA